MLLFCDSFDHYTTLTQKWGAANNSVSISATAARNGAKGMLVNANQFSYVTTSFSNKTTVIVGFAFNLRSINAQAPICSFYDGATEQMNLNVDQSGFLRLARGLVSGTTLATSLNTMTSLLWHYVEVKITFGTGTSGSCEVKLDGVSFASATGVNTANSGVGQCNKFLLGCDQTPTVTYWYDDVYVCDNTGSFNNDYLGDVVVKALLPTGNGTQNNFTIGGTAPAATNWQSVNENPPDDNVTYVSDGSPGDQDRYTFPALGITGTVKAAVVNLRAEKDDAGNRAIRAVSKSGGTTADNGSDFQLTQNTYGDYQGIFETDPNTSSAWSVSNLNSAEFGVKLTV